MQKRLLLSCLIVLMSCVPAVALELSEEAQKISNKSSTAYTSSVFNQILTACGVPALTPEAAATVDKRYARVADGKVTFNNGSMLYKPVRYHTILTAYGLELSPQEVAARLGGNSYAKVKNDKVVFGKTSTAFNKSEWKKILACYSYPSAAAQVTSVGDSDGDGISDDKDACPDTPAGIAVDVRGCWSHSSTLLFALDSSAINSEYKTTLDDAKRVFDANPNMNVQIDGYTCDLGSEAYNQKLSVRRAQSVKDYLVSTTGIAATRLTVKGYGETNPAFPNDSEENRAKNRRIEFTPVK